MSRNSDLGVPYGVDPNDSATYLVTPFEQSSCQAVDGDLYPTSYRQEEVRDHAVCFHRTQMPKKSVSSCRSKLID
jgi:hypothetical protein